MVVVRAILIILLTLSALLGSGQSRFSSIDETSKSAPTSLTTYSEIAGHLTKDLDEDVEKIRAIYIWIAHNIRYDLDLVNSNRRYESAEQIVEETIRRRVGICQHYSELFLAMSRSVGLESYLITGYSRDILGKISNMSHAWNGVEIDSKFYLIDLTWVAGYQEDGSYIHKFRDNYFMIPPSEFIKDHMPFDPIWQFLDTPIDNSDFISQSFTKLEGCGNFSFRDSIDQYKNLGLLRQLERSNLRITNCGLDNEMIKMQVDDNSIQITNLRYNLAIDSLNYGVSCYNIYIAHKNKQFNNLKLDDSEIKELIDNATDGVNAANRILNQLSTKDQKLSSLIDGVKVQIPTLLQSLKRENHFVNRYLETPKSLRIDLFIVRQ